MGRYRGRIEFLDNPGRSPLSRLRERIAGHEARPGRPSSAGPAHGGRSTSPR
jgi:hypothetical protein